MGVSITTENKLREAMRRLLEGTPLNTDGALTKENLAREAGVSHATVHRATTILAEWNAKVSRPVLRSTGEARRDETITELRKTLRSANQKITELNGKLDALASVTANLYHENQSLRSKLDRRTQVTALDDHRDDSSLFTCS
jgi:small-conductance mechanosensitive channel